MNESFLLKGEAERNFPSLPSNLARSFQAKIPPANPTALGRGEEPALQRVTRCPESWHRNFPGHGVQTVLV